MFLLAYIFKRFFNSRLSPQTSEHVPLLNISVEANRYQRQFDQQEQRQQQQQQQEPQQEQQQQQPQQQDQEGDGLVNVDLHSTISREAETEQPTVSIPQKWFDRIFKRNII